MFAIASSIRYRLLPLSKTINFHCFVGYWIMGWTQNFGFYLISATLVVLLHTESTGLVVAEFTSNFLGGFEFIILFGFQGFCQYGDSCKYYHPQNRLQNLSSQGISGKKHMSCWLFCQLLGWNLLRFVLLWKICGEDVLVSIVIRYLVTGFTSNQSPTFQGNQLVGGSSARGKFRLYVASTWAIGSKAAVFPTIVRWK